MERIFSKQWDLMRKYHPIEEENSTIFSYHDPDLPVDINSIGGQARLKHLAWYSVEEIAEAMEAKTLPEKQEEFVDSIHFFVELCLTAGYHHDFFDKLEDYYIRFSRNPQKHDVRLGEAVSRFIHALGSAMNQLKNKPWKKTHTSFTMEYRKKFEAYLTLAMFHLLEVGWTLGISSAKRLREVYMDKAAINQERQESGY